ncbi:ATP/GTP-binding protein [uncultured Duncaniella sp.]|uniref:AAA family ATPase n=2 Tax=Muribaculaceae TaxID=2005473 RepID=UPI002630E902|nr:AAA family ATPase [uncultured Duncaniella sp.]
MLTKIKFENFTAFTRTEIEFSKGINILIGENGSGKTHVMKALYSACCMIDEKEDRTFDQKLTAVFRPNSISRLVHRSQGRSIGKVEVYRRNDNDTPEQQDRMISCKISSTATSLKRRWNENKRNPATYIPVKDMLANAPGFRSLYNQKHIGYEEIYADIIDRALIPPSKGKPTMARRELLKILSDAISGRVIEKNETFYLKNSSGELEFPLLAEGFRKLGLLYTLIINDSLTSGSILFWDEPEANLNPKLAKKVVEVLLKLQRMGVQIFIATHDYVLLKEFEMAAETDDKISYHSLCLTDNGISHESSDTLAGLSCNPIRQAYEDILDRQLSNF